MFILRHTVQFPVCSYTILLEIPCSLCWAIYVFSHMLLHTKKRIHGISSHHPLQKVFRTFSRIHLFPQYRQKLQKQSQVTRIQEKKGNCITIVQFQISSLLLIIPLFSSFDHACRKSQLYNVHLLYYSLFQSIGLFIFTFCKPTLHLLSYSIGICAAVPYFRAFLAA